jgi:hypothetical protein
MAEHHEIIGPARGEPLPRPRVGACIRIPLESPPSPRWSQVLGAHLANSLTGHPAVGHLRLNQLVQGSVIVLEGVEEAEAEVLGPALREAIDAANVTMMNDPSTPEPGNMDQGEADRLAKLVSAAVRP